MKRLWSVTFAASVLAAVVLGSPARADDPAKGSKGSKDIEDPARVGRPGETPGQPPQAGTTPSLTREISGTVVKAEAKTLYLEHMGAIVPLKIEESTEFSGGGLKSSRDLTEGQAVRASFKVENETTNVAEKISVDSASGRGAPPPGHTEGMPPGGAGTPPERKPIPRDPGSPMPPDPGAPPIPQY